MVLHLDDAELHYDVHGDGEPLLWLHGALGTGADWQFIFGSSPPGYRLIAPDLRGHGRSTGAGTTYSFRQSAHDAFTLLNHLRVDRVKIIGMSGGGITALHMATIAPRRVVSMIVVSAPLSFPEQACAIQRTYTEAMLSEEERVQMRVRHPRPGQLDALFAQIRALPDGIDPRFTPETLAAVAAETLVVFGDRDPLYPVSTAVSLYEALPYARLWVVPNAAHGPVFGANAPRFVETALAFLAERETV